MIGRRARRRSPVPADRARRARRGGGPAPARPFGSHAVALAAGTLQPRVPAAALDRVTAAAYDEWARRYLEPACTPGQWRVDAGPEAPAHTVSEGQGYGMVIVALMAGHDPAAQERFDGLARYALDHPSSVDERLLALGAGRALPRRRRRRLGHRRRPRRRLRPPPRPRAVGLGRRDRLPRRRAAHARGRSSPRTCTRDTNLTTLGDWTASDDPRHWRATRPSDWMLSHFSAFAAATGDPRWNAVRAAHLRLIRRLPGRTGLLPDFVRTDGRPRPAGPGFLESSDDGRFSWNACRTPWRIGTDAALSGDPRSRAAAGEAEPLGAPADGRAPRAHQGRLHAGRQAARAVRLDGVHRPVRSSPR